MIGTGFWQYIFIHTCILLLEFTTPICLAILSILMLTRGWTALYYLTSQVLLAYSVVDLLYAILIYAPCNRRLKQEAKHPPPLSRAERKTLFEKCFAHIRDPDRYLRVWFLGADEAEIKRDNVRDFVMWAFLDRAPGKLSKEDSAELDEYVGIIEKLLGRKLESGRGKAESLRLTIDTVETRYRSLIWWLLVGIVDFGSHCQMAWNGFHYYAQPMSRVFSVIPPRLGSLFARNRSESEEFGYWYREHTAKNKRPVLFLHGIGIGLWTYGPFLSKLNKPTDTDGEVGILAVELLPVSFRLTRAPVEKLEFLNQIELILAAKGWDNFLLASHSYGSALCTHLIQSKSLGPKIDSVVLIDPVTILLHLPDVAFNFTRRKPRGANEWQLWYFASMDPGVAHTLGRHFFWKDNIIWKEELLGTAPGNSGHDADNKKTRKVAISLSERDLIVDTLTVARYLAGDEEWLPAKGKSENDLKSAGDNIKSQLSGGHVTKDGIEILWYPGLDHAQVFDSRRDLDRVCSVIRRYCIEVDLRH